MLKKRVIAALPLKSGIVVQSIGFRRYLPVGRPAIAAEFLNDWGVDEILLLDMDAAREGRTISPDVISQTVERCVAPLTAGGGIRTVDDITRAIHSGADKVAINTGAVEDPDLIARAAAVFGNQCIVVCLDARRREDGAYEVFTHGGRRATGRGPVELAQQAERLGAGEILIQSIDRDGTRRGYDLDLIRLLAGRIRIPLIALGGAGHPQHLIDAFRAADLSAVAVGNLLHYSEHSVTTLKARLEAADIEIRLDSYAHYRGRPVGPDGRILKLPDAELAEMIFEHIPPEVI